MIFKTVTIMLINRYPKEKLVWSSLFMLESYLSQPSPNMSLTLKELLKIWFDWRIVEAAYNSSLLS